MEIQHIAVEQMVARMSVYLDVALMEAQAARRGADCKSPRGVTKTINISWD